MLHVSCSGYGIAAQALTAIVRAHDGRGPQTMLTFNILRELGLSSPDELIGYISILPFYNFIALHDSDGRYGWISSLAFLHMHVGRLTGIIYLMCRLLTYE